MAAYRRKVRGGPLVSVDGLGLHDAVRAMWPASVPWSWAGQLVAALEGAARGERRRVVVSVPVRHGRPMRRGCPTMRRGRRAGTSLVGGACDAWA